YQLLTGTPVPADPGARPAVLGSPQMAFEEGAVPQDVLGILRKSLSPSPEGRFGTAAEFKRELEKLLYGGAYSPTTFNLALFMDRLYRNDIEQEDRELQKERSLDVAGYYQAPRPAGGEPLTPVVEQAAPNRTGLYAAIGAAVVLAGVVGFLLLRPSGAPSMDPDAVKAAVAKEFKAYNEQLDALKRENDEARARSAELQKQLEDSRKGAGPKKLTAEEEAKIQADLKAREDADRQRRERIAQIEAQKSQLEKTAAATLAKATVPAPIAAPVVPTPEPQPTLAAVAATVPPVALTTAPAVAVAPTEAPVAPPPTVRAQPAVAGVLSGGPAENEFIDPTLVDVLPQALQEFRPQYSRAFLMARAPYSGVVILKAMVNSKGLVEEVQILRPFQGPKLGVDEACADAARQYRFKPATKAGVKVKTWATVTIAVSNKH
ncbi:MAG TPA: TonB family protein, partial [Thermoanaerobaculaceae bacterium]|nr:TonB family protein [Thermoanaerobaculaceae bacterium]